MQDIKQRREEDDQENEQNEWYRMNKVNRDNIDPPGKRKQILEAHWMTNCHCQILDLLMNSLKQGKNKKDTILKFFDLPLRRDIDPELFLKPDFVYRKNSNSIAKIEYDGKEIYYFRLGERHRYANNLNSFEREAFDEKLKRAEGKYISSLDPIMDEEVPDLILPRGTSDAVLNRALTNLNLAVDRYANSEDVEEMENIEKVYTDAEKIFNDKEINPDEKQG